MVVSIDRAGRIVIPKDIRERLSLEADAEVEIEIDGDAIRLVPVRTAGRRIVDKDGLPVIERGDGPMITDADVQRWRDADRR
ncbi:AbrB family looped-hinge helix DNA binding protein [Ilumatobacter fluminis]|uniref:AbrB family looped-hinge helix DNA binding protein n=1 Tax=Ilumatobacter fluminis TaxID=467091 RepID=A0A4R7I3Q1_9ACTN|nr:AbrB/MazE/SpoVT family DNA-binding domain-containing protein [Ilumatobacter fluminis]TDT17296.1 AbrB family looped-hinge helix DNA binding protein [Ilumatobacter fluminis]